MYLEGGKNMTWDESKHPRDRIGRFTFSDGESNTDSEGVLKGRIEKTETKQSPADILYGKLSKKVKSKEEYRSHLLNILKDVTTPAKVLYAPIDELKKLAKEKIKKLGKKYVTQERIESIIGKNYEHLDLFAKVIAGLDGAGMLDLAHGIDMKDRNYIKDTISLDNYNDSKVESEKKYLKEKISQQFKDYNFDINKIKGYYFKPNSEPVKRLIQNEDFLNMVKSHKQEILQKGEFSAGFPEHNKMGLGLKNNFHNAIGKADFRNIFLDEKGNLHIKMYDTYDFNKNEKSKLIRAGASQMEKGVLKPFFTIHDIIIPKDILDEIWN